MNLFDVLGSVFGGGVTGLLGVAIQRVADYKNKKLDIELEKTKFQHEVAIQTLIANAKIEVADSEGFKESQKERAIYSSQVKPSEKQGWVLITLDVIRGTIRPFLTIYLCALTTLIYFHAKRIISFDLMAPNDATALVNKIIEAVLYLTVSAVLWWFGTRNKGKQPS